MLLHNVHIAGQKEPSDIYIRGERIVAIEASRRKPTAKSAISFTDVVAMPGLINSHDHLDFNLFPQLGNKVYEDYTEWAKYIHNNFREEIDAVLKVPLSLRLQWGLYKNLLCGVTTVVHHGMPVICNSAIVDVFQQCQSLHSVALEKHWRVKLNNPFNTHQPVAIHIGEGINNSAFNEINKLISNNYIRRNLIGIHSVAMNVLQAAKFKALIWCPASNYFMFNTTANMQELKRHTSILFGSDSTLTADWNIWNHVQLARKSGHLSDEELLASLTSTPADVWKLKNLGKIETNYRADILVATQNNAHGLDVALSVTPEDILMVIKQGNIQLFDEIMLPQLAAADINLSPFEKVIITDRIKYVRGSIIELITNIKSYYPEAQIPIEIVQKKPHAYIN